MIILLCCLSYSAHAARAMKGVEERWDPSTLAVPRWLHELPAESPIPLMLGSAAGIPGTAEALEAARQQGIEHLRYCEGALVHVDQTSIKRPPDSWHFDNSTVIPLGAPIPSQEVLCLAHFTDPRRNVTWCLAARASEAERAALEPLLMPYQSLRPYSSTPPAWMMQDSGQNQRVVATGYAQRTTRPSEQLRLALTRALVALARQGLVRAEVDTQLFRSPSHQRGSRRVHVQGAARVENVHLTSVWRSRSHDGLHIQVMGKIGTE